MIELFSLSPVGCIPGFTKASRRLIAPKKPVMISLPPGYIPKHVFNDDAKTINRDKQDQKQTSQQKLSSKDRSLMLGETTKCLDDVNQWSLKWDRPSVSDDIDVVDENNIVDEVKTEGETGEKKSRLYLYSKVHLKKPCDLSELYA